MQERDLWRWLGPLLIAAVAVAASISGIRNHWAQDDTALVQDDQRVHSLSVEGLRDIFTSPYWPPPSVPALYRPFATTSLVLQWALGDGNPVVFRVVSYLLYALVSLAVYFLGRRCLPRPVALGIAILFAAHPVHVESVALAVNQAEQWVGLLSILATIIYLDRRRRGWLSARDWAGVALLYVTAFLFKEHALVMPGFLLAAELTLLAGAGFGTLRERASRMWGWYTGLAALGSLFLVVRTCILNDFAGTFTAEGLVGQGIVGRTLTMLQVVPRWLGLLVWPSHLQGDYSPSVINQATTWGWGQTLGALVLAGVAVLLVVTWRRAPVVAFGILWGGGALLPVSNILVPTGIVLAERTLYLASIGFLLVVGGVTAHLLAGRSNPKPIARFLMGTTVVLVGLGIWRSAIRHPDWRNQLYYWAKTVQDAPLSYRAHHAHAQLLWELGYQRTSVSSFHTAIALYPRSWWIRNELANRFRRSAECHPAVELYEQSLGRYPDQPNTRASMIACLTYLGRYDDAITAIDSALLRSPGAPDLLAYRFTADSARRAGSPPGSVHLTAPEAAVLQ